VTPEELRRSPIADLVRRHRLIVVLRRIDPLERLRALVDELVEAGARIFEITMDGADAPAAISSIRGALVSRGDDQSLVGAGTVRTGGHLGAAIDAGADFAVSPVLDEALLAQALRRGLPFLPGALSPTEVDRAWRAGATFVKLFPASSVGPTHVRELRGPLGEIELVPTGGIDATSAAAYLAAGAAAVGIGSAIVSADAEGRQAVIAATQGDR
jgi:2-dehydro-3-deoxyphosphogluconate aldolase/(4S)-4-hydroxy-2-oxoglutarate aldolase